MPILTEHFVNMNQGGGINSHIYGTLVEDVYTEIEASIAKLTNHLVRIHTPRARYL